MADVALFRAGQTPQYLRSVHTPDYASDPDAIINPDVTAVIGVALKYWKRNGSLIEEMTAGEKAAVDAAEAAAALAARRTAADATKDAASVDGVELRAIVLILLDELNALRTWTRDCKAAVAASTSFGHFKTLVAALTTLSDRTLAQAKTAYSNKINTGEAD